MRPPDITEESMDRFLWQWLRIVHKLNRIERRSLDFGFEEKIHSAEIHTIDAIYDHKDINVTKLAQVMGVSKGAISQTLRKIQDKGYIIKSPHPENARERVIQLTDKGMEVVKKHDEYHKAAYSGLIKELESLTLSDFRKFNRLFSTMENQIDKSLLK